MSSDAGENIPWETRVELCNQAIAEELLEWGSSNGCTFTRAESIVLTDDEGDKMLGINVNTDCPDSHLNTLFCMCFSSLAEARWKRKCEVYRKEVVQKN